MSREPSGFDATEARRRALSWLARREYGRDELIEKLTSRGCDEAIAAAAVAALAAQGLVSDERFVESLIRVRRARGFGPLYIRRELEAKGIGRSMIEHWLDPRARDWLDELRRVKTKRFGAGRPASLAERARQTRFLQQRGFTHEQIREILGSDGE